MRIDHEHLIAHPADRVFAILSDLARRPSWQGNTSGVVILTSVPTELGTRWREQNRGIGAVEAEVVGFEPAALWEEAGTADGGEGRIAVRLRPEDRGSTHLTMTVELRLKGLRRVVEGALQPIVARQVPENLARLAALLDAEPPG
jgi:uncharacterized protein YndB with AHSA1/START domain